MLADKRAAKKMPGLQVLPSRTSLQNFRHTSPKVYDPEPAKECRTALLPESPGGSGSRDPRGSRRQLARSALRAHQKTMGGEHRGFRI